MEAETAQGFQGAALAQTSLVFASSPLVKFLVLGVSCTLEMVGVYCSG